MESELCVTMLAQARSRKKKIIVTFAKARNDGQLGRVHASAHEEDQVFVPGLPEGGHVKFERLQGSLLLHVLHVEDLDGDVAVPVALVDWKRDECMT